MNISLFFKAPTNQLTSGGSQNNSAIQSFSDVLMLILVLLILVAFIVIMIVVANFFLHGGPSMINKKPRPSDGKELTPTQKFILAASSVTLGREYKCLIDIWGTRNSEKGKQRAKELYEWGWGRLTADNARTAAEECMNSGYNKRFLIYTGAVQPSEGDKTDFSDFQKLLLDEMREKYPEQGMLAWDLVRTLSIVGGAYMGGAMKYENAAELALEACRRLQQSFSSWDDVAENYTLGYQYWRGRRSTDRLKYYKKLRKTWVYDIPWDTPLKEEEL